MICYIYTVYIEKKTWKSVVCINSEWHNMVLVRQWLCHLFSCLISRRGEAETFPLVSFKTCRRIRNFANLVLVLPHYFLCSPLLLDYRIRLDERRAKDDGHLSADGSCGSVLPFCSALPRLKKHHFLPRMLVVRSCCTFTATLLSPL